MRRGVAEPTATPRRFSNTECTRERGERGEKRAKKRKAFTALYIKILQLAKPLPHSTVLLVHLTLFKGREGGGNTTTLRTVIYFGISVHFFCCILMKII